MVNGLRVGSLERFCNGRVSGRGSQAAKLAVSWVSFTRAGRSVQFSEVMVRDSFLDLTGIADTAKATPLGDLWEICLKTRQITPNSGNSRVI